MWNDFRVVKRLQQIKNIEFRKAIWQMAMRFIIFFHTFLISELKITRKKVVMSCECGHNINISSRWVETLECNNMDRNEYFNEITDARFLLYNLDITINSVSISKFQLSCIAQWHTQGRKGKGALGTLTFKLRKLEKRNWTDFIIHIQYIRVHH